MSKPEKLDPKRVTRKGQIVRESTLKRRHWEAIDWKNHSRQPLTGPFLALHKRRQRRARRVRALAEGES